MKSKSSNRIIIRLPPVHSGGQEIFVNWNNKNKKAQCLICPSGVKTGKTFGSSLWMLKEALNNQAYECYWIAPSYLKCRIAFRYMSGFLPDHPWIQIRRTKMEIHFANKTFIKFLHGQDAETVIEGENIDRFVVDETSKLKNQVWLSLITTITQTRGKGIVTGTPRGFNWYYDVWKKAMGGDPFFVPAKMVTSDSPYVKPEAIAIAKRLLPPNLFAQYYLAEFTSASSIFGDLEGIWEQEFGENLKQNLWIRPDETSRKGEIVHGIDVAKKRDFTVIYSVNPKGQLVGFLRTKYLTYPEQVAMIKSYIKKYFAESENVIDYDTTGVGEAFGDILQDAQINAEINPVTFTNQSKAKMLTKVILAIQSGWHKAPHIYQIHHEFSVYEVVASRFGNHRYSAPEGEHDDIISAAMMAISRAYDTDRSDDAYKFLEEHMRDGPSDSEIIDAYGEESLDQYLSYDEDSDIDFDSDAVDL